MHRWALGLLLVFGLAVGASAEPGEEPRPRLDLRSKSEVGYSHGPEDWFTRTELEWRRTYAQDPDDPLADRYYEAGLTLTTHRAVIRAALHAEAQPLAWLSVKVQYDLYGFMGAYGGLLAFPDADARFGDHERRRGVEDTGFGHRLLFQPTIRLGLGPLVFWSQTDLALYSLPGQDGRPYLLELEYDTLLKEDLDGLVAQRAALLLEVWDGDCGISGLQVGVGYEVVYALGAELVRQRVGGLVWFVPTDECFWWIRRPRAFLWAGATIDDRNREDDLFLVVGIGWDLDLQ